LEEKGKKGGLAISRLFLRKPWTTQGGKKKKEKERATDRREEGEGGNPFRMVIATFVATPGREEGKRTPSTIYARLGGREKGGMN